MTIALLNQEVNGHFPNDLPFFTASVFLPTRRIVSLLKFDNIARVMIPGMQTRRIEPDITVVELIGTLSLGNTLSWIETDIRRQIKEGARKLIIDISQLRYTDSAGIGMFIIVNGELEQAKGVLRIAGASGIVAKSFTVTHLDRVILLDPDIEVSLAKLRE